MGGNVAIYTQYGISEANWNLLGPQLQALIKDNQGEAAKIAELFKKGYTAEQISSTYGDEQLGVKGTFVEKTGGNVDYKQFGITEKQWNQFSPKTQAFVSSHERAAQQVAKLIQRGYTTEQINDYFNSLDIEVPVLDETAQKTKLEGLRTEAAKITPDMMENRTLREASETKWEAYFLERYRQNPLEARRDIVQVLYRKDVMEAKQVLQNMMTDTKGSILLKSKYLAEGFATEDEQKAYDARRAELRSRYIDEPRAPFDAEIRRLEGELAKLPETDTEGRAAIQRQIDDQVAKREKASTQAALDAYNDLKGKHAVVQEKDLVHDGEHLTTAQLEALIDLVALDEIHMTESKIQEMAIQSVSQSVFNKGVAEVKKINEEIEKLKADNTTPEIEKIKGKAINADREFDRQIAQLLQEAETEDSTRLRNEAHIADQRARDEIRRLRQAGQDNEADALELKRLEDKKAAQEQIKAAMDQTKLTEVDRLLVAKKEAHEKAEQEAFNALPEKVRNKIKKLEAKAEKIMREANEDSNKLVTDNLDDISKAMAETQVDRMRAQNKFNNTVVKYDKLDDDIQAWIKEDPSKFARVAKDGEVSTFKTVKPVLDDQGRPLYNEDGSLKEREEHWVFDGEMFKNYMLALSNDNNLDNSEAVDPTHNADYYADIQDRKSVTYARKGEEAPDKLKDRRFAKRCFEAAGIETEGDRTIGKRIGHAATNFAKGFLIGSAAAGVAEYLSTTKVVNANYSRLVEYCGSVPWSEIVNYSGTATGNYSGTANGTVTVTHIDYQNGIPIGEYTENIDVSLPYSGSIEIPYEGSTTVSGEAYYSGQETVSGQTSASPDFSLKNVLGAGAIAGFTTMLVSLPQTLKIKDEGMREEAVRRQVLSDKGVEQPTVIPTPEPLPVDINANLDVKEDITEVTTPETREELTVEVQNTVKVIQKATNGQNGVNEGYTWASLQNAYISEDNKSVPNTPAFRNWFRKTYLNGATSIGTGAQHYPKTIVYNNVTYTFDKEKYKPNRYTTSASGGNITYAKTEKKVNVTPGSTSTQSNGWSAVATATWTDESGKTQTKTVRVTGCKDKDSAIAEAKAKLQGEVPANAKIRYGTKAT